MTRRSPKRRGYALLIVVIFGTIFMGMMAMAWRHMDAAMRTFAVRTACIQRDQGTVRALADAMHALEAGPPPFEGGSDTYVCYDAVEVYPVVQLKTSTADMKATKYYQITFVRTSEVGVTPRTYMLAVEEISTTGMLPPLDTNSFAAVGP